MPSELFRRRHCKPPGPREARPDDRLREAIQSASAEKFWIASAFAKASADKSLRSQ
jgi:hypothetical protein